MARPVRPSSLLWGLFLALGGTALVLRLRVPGHWALPWITATLLLLLALRVIAMVWDWQRGRIPGTRILLPVLILVEGLGLILTRTSHRALRVRLGTALALEIMLLIPTDLFLIHALFPRMAPWLRWSLHVSTVYSVLWMIGLYVTLKQRPHQIDETFVSLHMGLLGALRVRSDQILAAAPFPEFDDDWVKREYMKGMHKLLRTGAPAVELRLAGPVACTGVMGPSSRRYDRVAVSVDDPSAFLAALGRPCA